jgi:SAM-dependent methyltransferase
MDIWHSIWNSRKDCFTSQDDIVDVTIRLKEANGFDVTDSVIGYNEWNSHCQRILKHLGTVDSIYEIGCGSGANLVLFQELGISKVGGCDYSKNLIEKARSVVKSEDLMCIDALNCPEIPHYDAVIIDSVTQYFPSIEYAEMVFERMVSKARKAIAILDIIDSEMKEEWLSNRKAIINDYANKYEGLDNTKLCIDRSFFETFAQKHGLKLTITETDIKGYWNGKYTYGIYLRHI